MKAALALMSLALALGILAPRVEGAVGRLEFSDPSRDREIPAAIYEPTADQRPPRLAIISAGYGVPDTEYSFLATALCRLGFLVACMQHHHPADAPLAQAGDLRALRLPAWQTGARDLEFVLTELRRTRPSLDTARPVLIGHSNGGDIACLFATSHPAALECLITLDHRRMPLPRIAGLRCLSIRAAEFEADPGVLPIPEEANTRDISIVLLTGTKHMDLTDRGPASTRQAVVELVTRFVAPPIP
ncbi:MAG TPA: hypothetical protein VK178_11045 [Opitutaceae bacterium]|nr:hypothetical protein [Opitutaceae bacterium]